MLECVQFVELQAPVSVLVVYDQSVAKSALASSLENMYTHIVHASSLDQAVHLLETFEFGLVLLDIDAVDALTSQAIDLLRQCPSASVLPIIVIGSAFPEQGLNFEHHHHDVDYLLKPLNPNLLNAKVHFFLELYHQRASQMTQLLAELDTLMLKLEDNHSALDKMASHDMLTQLPNRQHFEESLSRCFKFSDRHRDKFAIIIADIDDFKSINDRFGHALGDKLLAKVSNKIRGILRQEDFLARIGGDEFAIILPSMDSYDAAGSFAALVQSLFCDPITVGEQTLDVSVSLGIACYPYAGENQATLLKNADNAMYRAKAKGKNTYEFFTDHLSKEYLHRATVENALSKALVNNEFYLVYQIIYNLNTGEPYGVESLVRWQHPKLGDVSPVEFIPVAEEMGLINQIGAWIIDKSCEQFSNWSQQGFEHLNFATNLSPRQLQQPDLVSSTKASLDKHGLSPDRIIFELTETAIMEDAQGEENMLRSLHQMGVRISIDDFGTGYSSLMRLRYLPIYALKIDRSFISASNAETNDAIIVKSILSLANSLGLKVIAEGVETQGQYDFLRDHACHYAQGYHLSEPLPYEEIVPILKQGARHG